MIMELYRGTGRYALRVRGAAEAPVPRGMILDCVITCSDWQDVETALEELLSYPPCGPDDLPLIGTLRQVLIARRVSRKLDEPCQRCGCARRYHAGDGLGSLPWRCRRCNTCESWEG